MKILKWINILIFGMLSCSSEKELRPQENYQDIQGALRKTTALCDENRLIWLSDILQKAEEDRMTMTHKGNFIGIISLIKYKNQPALYTNFALGSGGIAFYLFDCAGNPIPCEVKDAGKIPALASVKENIIYASSDVFIGE